MSGDRKAIDEIAKAVGAVPAVDRSQRATTGGKEDFAWHVWTAENLVLGADPVFRWLRRDGFNNRLFLNQEER